MTLRNTGNVAGAIQLRNTGNVAGNSYVTTVVQIPAGTAAVSVTMEARNLGLGDECLFSVSIDGGSTQTEVLKLTSSSDGVETTASTSVTVPTAQVIQLRMTNVNGKKWETCLLSAVQVTCA